MKNKLPNIWLTNLNTLDIAFQPIVNIHTGRIYAVEALLRNYQDVGFQSIFALFDAVYNEGILYLFDLALRRKAIHKFTKIKNFQNIKLFYNLDNRLFDTQTFPKGATSPILKEFGVKKENMCFEISERHEICSDFNIRKVLQHYKNENYSIAIDDFGVGYAGYKLLYDSTPDIIKIDRFFLQNIEKNLKKKLMVRSITNLAIQLGIKVIAEGVETKEELFTCKEIGCHLVQGYFIKRPTKDTNEILNSYDNIKKVITNDKRERKDSTIANYIEHIKPLESKTKMNFVIEYFKHNKNTPVVPITTSSNEPLGLLHESDIKDFLYSPFGISLLLNNENKKSKLKNMLHPCASADINSSIHTIVELFSNNTESVGVIITQNSMYYGFLSARAIISIMNEENLLVARDQNPLTKLPGNTLIEQYISKTSQDTNSYILCYFDLDNFKVFNDVYGFRNGDRVIQLFANILKNDLEKEFFKAHIGGDDFFIAIQISKNMNVTQAIKRIQEVIIIFSENAKNFYSQKDQENTYVLAKDRDGNKKKFNLLSVSASIIEISQKSKSRCVEDINSILSIQKKVAKAEAKHLAISSLL